MTNELKPVRCGCGGEAVIYVTHWWGKCFVCECDECGTASRPCNTESEAITAWNKAMGADKRSDLAITKGYWMATYDGLRCSICNYKLDTTAMPDICPRCGLEMKQ